MNNINIFFLRIIAICLMGLLPVTVVWSADEDMISQVYLEFDPETGEFVTAQDPTLTSNSRHSAAQAQQVEEIQRGQEALAASLQNQPQATSSSVDGQRPMNADEIDDNSDSTMLIVGIIVLGLLIGIVTKVKKRQQTV